MFGLSRASTIRVLAVLGALIAVLGAISLLNTQEADAGVVNPTLQCQDLDELVSGGEANVACVVLSPKTDTNTVGEQHIVTATVTLDGEPFPDVCLYILVIQGPDMGQQISGVTDSAGELRLTYNGSGPGTDMIATEVALVSNPCDSFIEPCLADPESCVETFFEHPTCEGGSNDQYLCDNATKDWIAPTSTPTPAPTGTPAPTASPTPQPSVTPTATPSGSNAIWGDDDCNGAVAAVDALKDLQEVAGIPYSQTDPCFPLGDSVGVTVAGTDQILWGDVDCDGDVDAVDAFAILSHIVAFAVNQVQPCPAIGDAIFVE